MARKSFRGNWLTREKRLLPMIALATAFTSAAPAECGAQSSTIFVSTVAQLYEAVNDATNAGATIVLTAGTYTLSAIQPNGGRLDLQLDMSLVGVENDAGAVTIDASTLPQSSFNFTIGRTGIIRTGRGNNTIEWLTIAGNPLAAASIGTDLLQTDALGSAMPTSIRVAHVVASNSARGVDIRNATVATRGRRIVADIEDNDFSWGVEGVRVANFVGADEGEITVDMRGNHSYGNRLGCILENNRSSNASIAVRSEGDRFYDNGLGCQIGGGLGSSGAANNNTTRFDAHESQFTNNIRTEFNTAAGGPLLPDKGGLMVAGAAVLSTGTPYSTSGNTAIVRLWDCQIAGNHLEGRIDFEFEAFGARSDLSVPDGADPTDYVAGTDNHTLVQLRGSTAFVEVVQVDSQVDGEPVNDPNGTNTVTVVTIANKPHQ